MKDAAPPDWSDTALLDLVQIKSHLVDPRDDRYRDLPLIAPDHLASGTGRLLKRESASSQNAISGKYLVMPGDVIYSKIRPYLQKAYKCDFRALCSADMYPLSPRPGTDSSFVLHSLLGQDFTEFAVSVSARSGIPKINREELAEYRLKTPTSGEQRAIGRALDDADRSISSLERLIAKKQAIKQGMMQQLLTGRTRFDSFTGPYKFGVLGDIAEVVMGQSPVGSSYNRHRAGSPLINGPTEFTDRYPAVNQWTTAPIRFCRAEDVLICVRGSSTGRTNIADRAYCIGRGVAAVRAKNGNSQTYTQFVLEAVVAELLKLQTGSTFPSIDSRVILSGGIYIPDQNEQAAIGNALADIDSEIEVLRERGDKARDIKTGMMQRLLTGRTRLPVEAES